MPILCHTQSLLRKSSGHFIRVPPRGPVYDLAQAVAALDAASKISGPTGRALTKNVYDAIGAIAKSAGKSLQR
jgi:hypothetical protein